MANTPTTPRYRQSNPDRQTTQQNRLARQKLPATRTNYRPSRQTCHAGVHYTHDAISLFPISLSLFVIQFVMKFHLSAARLNSPKNRPAWPVGHFTGHSTSHIPADRIPTTPINQSSEMLKNRPH